MQQKILLTSRIIPALNGSLILARPNVLILKADKRKTLGKGANEDISVELDLPGLEALDGPNDCASIVKHNPVSMCNMGILVP
jgi:hypothetical protein